MINNKNQLQIVITGWQGKGKQELSQHIDKLLKNVWYGDYEIYTSNVILDDDFKSQSNLEIIHKEKTK